jgi:hypothetical protein
MLRLPGRGDKRRTVGFAPRSVESFWQLWVLVDKPRDAMEGVICALYTQTHHRHPNPVVGSQTRLSRAAALVGIRKSHDFRYL